MKLILFAIISIVSISAVAFSSTYYVPTEYGTIQAGINACAHGDTLIVRPGMYNENINLQGKAILLKGEKDAEYTIINGAQLGSVVTCNHGERQGTVLQGFTIYNGSASYGGGMFNSSASPTVIDCVFYDNRGTKLGGGMYNDDSSPAVKRTVFLENTASAYGGGMSNKNSMPVLTQCIFKDNSSMDGGGIYNKDLSDITVVQCTFHGNTAITFGGAIYNSSSTPTVINTILWGNWPEQIDGHAADVTYSCIQYGYIGTGNIAIDPLFVDPAQGDLHLRFTSPCRNAGSNAAPGLPAEDFENDPRIAHGTVDMGVDEFYPHLYCTGSFTPNGWIEGKFIGLPATWPLGLFVGFGVLDPPLQHGWGAFYLTSPWYLFPLVPVPVDGVLAIPTQLPGTPAPYDIPMQALIDWELSNLFVLEVR